MNMTKMKQLSLLGLAVVAAGCANLEHSRNLADPAAPPKALAQQVCSTCHGVDGNPVSPAFPRLAAQTPAYITSQLNNFRGHGRSDPAGSEYMWGLSAHLTDEQIAGFAAYYAAQVAKRSPQAGRDAAQVARGKEIFEKGVPDLNVMPCATCHGPQAAGNEVFPRLAYQHADYIVKQLGIFQNTHGGRPGTPMAAVVFPLPDADKEAVAAYLEAMPD
jgi:cytochrome c553